MINWKRDYGHVFGDPGVAYEQDGKLYDAMGREVEKEPERPKRGRPPKQGPDEETV